MLLALFFFISCGPKSNADCTTYLDTCEAGCELQCGTIKDAEKAEKESCDLGCIDSGAPAQCIFIDGTCDWAE